MPIHTTWGHLHFIVYLNPDSGFHSVIDEMNACNHAGLGIATFYHLLNANEIEKFIRSLPDNEPAILAFVAYGSPRFPGILYRDEHNHFDVVPVLNNLPNKRQIVLDFINVSHQHFLPANTLGGFRHMVTTTPRQSIALTLGGIDKSFEIYQNAELAASQVNSSNYVLRY
jgi:hypothetical protein